MTQVKFIEHDGKKIPYRVAWYALSELKKETGKGLKDLDNLDDDMTMLGPLFYHSVIAGFTVINKKCPYKRDEVLAILDLYWMDIIGNVKSFFQEGVSQAKKAK